MDDLVEIGVFAGQARRGSPGESLYLRQHRIRAGKQTIVLTVPRLPTRAGIDPYHKLIERQRDDNVAAIRSGAPIARARAGVGAATPSRAAATRSSSWSSRSPSTASR
jgi:hypothetical protein